MVATDFEIWAGKWLFEMSHKEENELRLRYCLTHDCEKGLK